MTIDNKVEEYPLFIKGTDFRFGNEPCYFYFIGIQRGSKELDVPDVVMYNSDKSYSTYSYNSIIQNNKDKLRVDTYLEIARQLNFKDNK